jgi:hypothetical protein
MRADAQPRLANPNLRFALIAVTSIVVTTAARSPASACTIQPYPDRFGTDTALVAIAAPPALRLASVTLRRARHAPPGNGDCGEVGHLALRFVQADGSPWPAEHGIRLTVTSDTPPGPFTIPSYPMATAGGALYFGAGDDPSLPINFELAAVAVNAAGVESAPIVIRVSDDGAGGGCSMGAGARGVPAVLIAAVVVLGAALARRRRAV